MVSTFDHMLAGCSAGIIGTVIGYPFDSLKTRMQTSNLSIRCAISAIYSESGIKGFYRGVVAPLISLTILNTLNFTAFFYFYQSISNCANRKVQFDYVIPISGACVGPISSLISTPFELIKTQMQLNMKFKQSNSPLAWKLALNIVSSYGIRSLYKGHAVNTFREIIFLSSYFTIYHHLKQSTSSYSPTISVTISGGIAGAMGWLISFPLDCIKSNIQSQPVEERSRSIQVVARELVNTRGLIGLYSGVIPSILRAFFVSSSRFSTYEKVLWLLDGMRRRLDTE